MNLDIDFEKSVRRKRLTFQGTRKERIVHSIKSFASGVILLMLCLSLVGFAYFTGTDPLLLPLLAIPALVVIISLFLQNRLAKTKGFKSHDDQMAIIRYLLRKYPGIIRHNCSEQIIIITYKPKSFFNKEFLILQDGEDIYMNMGLFSRGDLKYMFLSIPQYMASRTLLKHFRRSILKRN